MFGKKKCDAGPVFKDIIFASSDEQERAALANLMCPSKAKMIPGDATGPSAAALVTASQQNDAVWLHGRKLECERCKKTSFATVARPAGAGLLHPSAVRAKARPDFYALQHALLPEWFLKSPENAIKVLSNMFEEWQSVTMKRIGDLVERTAGDPMPMTNVQAVSTPGETPAILIDFMPPCAPVEAHYALLVGGNSPRFFLSEKTHLGDDKPVLDIAGLTEWAYANPARTEMKHTAVALLPDTSRQAFYQAATDLLKRGLA